MKSEVVYGVSRLTDHDVYLFKEGTHARLYEKMGCHPMDVDGRQGAHFAVWAPNARELSVIGDFNGWNNQSHFLSARQDGSGIWEGFIPGITPGTNYKYHIRSNAAGYWVDKGDPFAFLWEEPPRTASRAWDLSYHWNDSAWMASRGERNSLGAPMSVYEVHPGSWRRRPDEQNRSLTYREMAVELVDYLREMNFTHVEFMPVMEHPFYGSWGYQTLGYFAPSVRFGLPQDFMYLVDCLHQAGIGVLLDWVPSHFPGDEYGLGFFDGTHLFEHADPRQGYHPDWNSYIFNYGRHEVRSFLLSSAMFWVETFHADGLRVDAVASMLYLDYSRKDGEWIPNEYGGKENIPAIEFLRKFNETLYGSHPDTQTVAEESTAWPMVSRPAYVGGLGFGLKWNMGWMHDTLSYFSQNPVHRKYHHNQLTFSIWYAFTENFMLPLSHDEVVHGKGSLIGKMPGDDWQKFANLRLLYGYMYGQPGKKLLFMGGEIGQWAEWSHESSVEWNLLDFDTHRGMKRWVEDLNRFYRDNPAMHQLDFSPDGFQWIDLSDADQSVLSFLRKGRDPADAILAVFNFTPVPRYNYRLGVPTAGYWAEVMNSDAKLYGGSGHGNLGGVDTLPVPSHGQFQSVSLTLPPLAAVFFRNSGSAGKESHAEEIREIEAGDLPLGAVF